MIQDRRPEIQALRALAVLIVVIYHFWPGRLTGGYVGVDAFFAISGYLITAHLLRETERTGTVDVPAFWARRIRRLLPASLLVLLATTVATVLWIPAAFWGQFLRETAAAAGYVVNWVLAADAVDYLGAENQPSPVQHFWSLSVEEQFYLIWPLLIVGALLLARRRAAGSTGAVAIVLGTVTGASLIASIALTATVPAAAYFITPTRAWEFGAGALLALVPLGALRARGSLAAALSWIGLAAIGAAALLYTAATPFPGIAAALPVAGALLVMAAGAPAPRWAPTFLMGLRPVQFLGDISYSVYLWHWPAIILLPYVLGREPGTMAKLVVLIVVLLLAWATKVLVEDPVRTRSLFVRRRPRATFVAMLAGIALVAGTPVAVLAVDRVVNPDLGEQIDARMGDACFGATALSPGADCADEPAGTLVPRRSTIYDDTQGAFACYDASPGPDLSHCSFGDDGEDALRVALVGDSHGAMLIPGLRETAADVGWLVDAYVGRGCVWAQSDLADADESCRDRNAAFQELFETGERYDVILVAARRDLDAADGAASRLFATAPAQWAPVAERGTRIVAIADNPLVPEALVNCVVDADSDAAARDCDIPRDDAIRQTDGLADAARAAGADVIALVDLLDFFCTDERCPMVVGDVIVYRDRDHMTATYARSLTPFLVSAIQEQL